MHIAVNKRVLGIASMLLAYPSVCSVQIIFITAHGCILRTTIVCRAQLQCCLFTPWCGAGDDGHVFAFDTAPATDAKVAEDPGCKVPCADYESFACGCADAACDDAGGMVKIVPVVAHSVQLSSSQF